MAPTQSKVAGVVVIFARPDARPPAALAGACLTPMDRIQITAFQDKARLAGYDRMVIHDRDAGDACEVGNFLSIHRSGEAWSRWGFARAGARVRAWCCLRGADVGEYGSLGEALQEVLIGTPVAAKRTTNLVQLRPRLGDAA